MKPMKVALAGVVAVALWHTGIAWGGDALPNLVGTWESGSYSHHHEQRGFFTNRDADGVWVVEKQDGRFFTGKRSYTQTQNNNRKVTEGFSGVLSRDGKRLYLVDHEEDYLFGEFLPDGSIELIMMNDGDKSQQSRIGVLEIKRVK